MDAPPPPPPPPPPPHSSPPPPPGGGGPPPPPPQPRGFDMLQYSETILVKDIRFYPQQDEICFMGGGAAGGL